MIKTLHLYRRSPQCWRFLSSPQLSDQLRFSSHPFFFLPDDDPWFKWLLWNVHSPPNNLSEWEAAPPGLASAYIDQRKRFACLLKFVSFTSRGRKTPRNGKVWLGLYLRSILMRLGVFYSHHTLGEVINGSVTVLTFPAGRCLAPYLTSIIYYIRWLICIHTIQIWKK